MLPNPSIATRVLVVITSAVTLLVADSVRASSLGERDDLAQQQRRRTTLVSLSALAEAYSILHPASPIPYLGLGHFYARNPGQGLFYFTAEMGSWMSRNRFRDHRGFRSPTAYPNRSTDAVYYAPGTRGFSARQFRDESLADLAEHSLFYVRLVDLYASYEGLRRRNTAADSAEVSVPRLMMSPFKPRYLLSPWVLVPALVGGVGSYLVTKSDRSLRDAAIVETFGSRMSPSRALGATAGIEVYRQILVAAGEEMYFRGVIQREIAEWGHPNVGILASSVLFGVWHVPNNGAGTAFPAFLGGLYTGYMCQRTGYDLGQSIAVHFWGNFLSTTGEFIKDPTRGDFIYSITWRI